MKEEKLITELKKIYDMLVKEQQDELIIAQNRHLRMQLFKLVLESFGELVPEISPVTEKKQLQKKYKSGYTDGWQDCKDHHRIGDDIKEDIPNRP
jgi:hypothetical protein